MAERIMVIGDGGREDAFARMALESGNELFVPDTMADISRHYADASGDFGLDTERIIEFAREKEVDSVFIGPEAPLVDGVADTLRSAGFNTFGVSAEAAQFEASKIFSHNFNQRHNIPQPRGHVLANYENALRWVHSNTPESYVIKADGLAAGKGVVLPKTIEDAVQTVSDMMKNGMFGEAGERILMQERIRGREVSIFALFDGEQVLILPATQDHKRLNEGDKGPNTGGMGAYIGVPNHILSESQMQQIKDRIIEPAFAGMQSEGIEFEGALFVGITLDEDDRDPVTSEPLPKVLEYNVRFGDPEAEVLFPTMNDPADLLENIQRIARGEKLLVPQGYDPMKSLGKIAMTVCLAGEGYPTSKYNGDRQIYGAQRHFGNDIIFNHANTWIDNFGYVHSKGGGRMGYLTVLGSIIDDMSIKAYSIIGNEEYGISSPGMQYRTDIAWQARRGFEKRVI